MKKKIINIIYLSMIIVIPCKAYSLDITAGATLWYAWGSRFENLKEESIRNNNEYAFDPALFYGPALSIKLSDDFNLTFVYLYSKFDYTEDVYSDLGGTYSVDSKITRRDSDLALNYRLSNYFKVFAGAKYLSYEIKSSYDDIYRGHCYSEAKHYSIGPGLGISATYPVTGNIFILGTVSGFYLFSNGEDFKDNQLYDGRTPKPIDITIAYNEYGINTNISAAYYIAPISTVISLGFRYQYFITEYSDYAPFLIESIENQIYGVTLTATYTFDI
jgi:hypothetical protein